jgi:hypothetical protein
MGDAVLGGFAGAQPVTRGPAGMDDRVRAALSVARIDRMHTYVGTRLARSAGRALANVPGGITVGERRYHVAPAMWSRLVSVDGKEPQQVRAEMATVTVDIAGTGLVALAPARSPAPLAGTHATAEWTLEGNQPMVPAAVDDHRIFMRDLPALEQRLSAYARRGPAQVATHAQMPSGVQLSPEGEVAFF